MMRWMFADAAAAGGDGDRLARLDLFGRACSRRELVADFGVDVVDLDAGKLLANAKDLGDVRHRALRGESGFSSL